MNICFSGADDEYLNCNKISIEQDVVERENIDTLDKLITYIYLNEPRARKSFYKTDGTLANGTICLVDDQDIELRSDRRISPSSSIVFISTLHGG